MKTFKMNGNPFYLFLCIVIFAMSSCQRENNLMELSYLENIGYEEGMLVFENDEHVRLFLENYEPSNDKEIQSKFESFKSYQDKFETIKAAFMEDGNLPAKFEHLVITDVNNLSQVRQLMPLFPPHSGFSSLLNENASFRVNDEIVVYKNNNVFIDKYTMVEEMEHKIKAELVPAISLNHNVVSTTDRGVHVEDDCDNFVPNENRRLQGELGWYDFYWRWGYYCFANSNYEKRFLFGWDDITYVRCSAQVFVDGVAGCVGDLRGSCVNPGIKYNSDRIVWAGKYVWPGKVNNKPRRLKDVISSLGGVHKARVSHNGKSFNLACGTFESM